MNRIETIYVEGAGFMGAGIAQNAVTAGYNVILHDMNREILYKAENGIHCMLEKLAAKGKLSVDEKQGAIRRLTLSENQEAAADADMVIEAVIENVEIKQKVFQSLSAICKEDAIFATNTSSISIAEIASSVTCPERFLGMHFFSPVPLMKLLEIVRGIGTDEQTIEMAKTVGSRMGKVCIVAKDRPAFIVNRMLDPMLNEAIEILDAGTGSIEDIDSGARYGLNHPMGPLELLDMVGIDVELAVMQVLYRETGDPKYRPSGLLKNMVRMGWTGKKAGIGFYIYHMDGTREPNHKI